MKVCVAVVCAVVALVAVQVHAAPTDVKASQLVDRLKELLRQRKAGSAGVGTKSNGPGEVPGEGPVDLENDGGEGPIDVRQVLGRKISERGPGLTQDEKNRCVSRHNELRKGEGSSNMESLRWSDRLAELAQDWADRCAWGHRPPNSYNPQDYGFSSVGENIWAWSVAGVKRIPEDPIQDWFDEKQYYVYNTGQCMKEPCGHYTTETWAGTTHIGCGYAQCGYLQNAGYNDGIYMVCNYGPWGGGQPFKKGESCTECDRGQFYCTDSMCDSSCNSAGGGRCECKAKCHNGQLTGDCKCQCQQGYSGPSCSDRCEDKDPQCGANPGWPQSWCTDKNVFGGMMYDTVNEECPKMCGHCVAKRDSVIDDDAAKLDNAELEFLIGALQKND